MFGYGCRVSQYLQFYDQVLEEYQVLIHPYLGTFGVYSGGEWVLDLAGEAAIFVLECIERLTSEKC